MYAVYVPICSSTSSPEHHPERSPEHSPEIYLSVQLGHIMAQNHFVRATSVLKVAVKPANPNQHLCYNLTCSPNSAITPYVLSDQSQAAAFTIMAMRYHSCLMEP